MVLDFFQTTNLDFVTFYRSRQVLRSVEHCFEWILYNCGLICCQISAKICSIGSMATTRRVQEYAQFERSCVLRGLNLYPGGRIVNPTFRSGHLCGPQDLSNYVASGDPHLGWIGQSWGLNRDYIYADLILRNLLARNPSKIWFGHRKSSRHESTAILSGDILTFQGECIWAHPEPPWSWKNHILRKCKNAG